MVTQEEINGYFLEIVRWLKSEYGYTQEHIVSQAKLAQNAISKIKNGKNNAGDETIAKLCDAFKLNPDYFYGRSPYKTLHEKSEAKLDEDLHDSQEMLLKTGMSIDPSSQVNAIIAAKDDAIESLKRELLTKDDLIQSLRDQLATKDQLIAEQKARLIDYRRIIDSHESGIDKYPFPIGAADGDKRQRKSK